MSKTQLSSAVKVGRRSFTTNAKPDPYDFRDLEYRPVLQPLDPSVHANRKDAAFTVLTQEGQSCTGHAVAATINTVLTRGAQRPHSPEGRGRSARTCSIAWPGATTNSAARRTSGRSSAPRSRAGSPRRRLEREWNQRAAAQRSPARRGHRPRRARLPGLVPAATARRLLPGQRLPARRHAVGHQRAPRDRRLGAIHEAGRSPKFVESGRQRVRRDRPRRGAEPKGGHAFALVGYNEIGFLVQNSWGTELGRRAGSRS